MFMPTDLASKTAMEKDFSVKLKATEISSRNYKQKNRAEEMMKGGWKALSIETVSLLHRRIRTSLLAISSGQHNSFTNAFFDVFVKGNIAPAENVL